MTTEVIGVKTALALGSALVSAVTAYWLAVMRAKKDSTDLEAKIAELRQELATIKSTAQKREDVKEVVKESLDGLIVLLKEIRKTVDSNNEDIKEVLIAQGILTQRVNSLERRRD